MSHEIEQHDTVTVADGLGTWHNINTLAVDNLDTFESTRLNWQVEQYPLSVSKEGQVIEIPDYFVNMREDINLPLGVVGNQYRIIQNERVYDAVQEIFDNKARIITAGSLFNCRKIWFLAALEDEAGKSTINNEVFENYLLGSSSHDGSSALEFRLTMVRVVCNNTLSLAMRSTKDCFKISHTESADYKIIQAEKFYDEVFNGIDKTKAVLEILSEKECDTKTAYAWATGFIKGVSTRGQNLSRRITQLFSEGRGNEGQTRYDLLNGVTERFTHGAVDGKDDNDSKIKEFVSSTFGNGNARKVAAMDYLIDDEKFLQTVDTGKRMNTAYLESEAAANTTSLLELNLN